MKAKNGDLIISLRQTKIYLSLQSTSANLAHNLAHKAN